MALCAKDRRLNSCRQCRKEIENATYGAVDAENTIGSSVWLGLNIAPAVHVSSVPAPAKSSPAAPRVDTGDSPLDPLHRIVAPEQIPKKGRTLTPVSADDTFQRVDDMDISSNVRSR